jgi:hypothetical protein
MDRLASFPLDLMDPPPAERRQEPAVERKADLEIADDQVEVIDMSHDGVLLNGA